MSKKPDKTAEEKTTKDDVVTAPASETAAETVVTAEKVATYIYVGPSIPKGRLKKGSVFRGTHSAVLKHLGDIITAYPEVRDMIVTSDMLSDAKARLLGGGNLLSESYKALQDRFIKK